MPIVPASYQFDRRRFLVTPGEAVSLSERSTTPPAEFDDKKEARQSLQDDVSALKEAQRLLWADGRFAVLIILQGMDAAGKDSTIRHVMSGVNPQGCEVHSFGPPSEEELKHHFLWRPTRSLPARGRIGIFNRSYYEEVLVVRVHPEWLRRQHLPLPVHDNIWQQRFEDINAFEKTLKRNGTVLLKFFLHLSQEEQKRRFLKRLENPEKYWKFSAADLRERRFWNDYQQAYEEMLQATSTEEAPWYVVPADKKWFLRAVVADVVAATLNELDLRYPQPDESARQELAAARHALLQEHPTRHNRA